MTDFIFTADERERLLANLFHASHPAVHPIEKFYWHTGRSACDTHLPHSSQALAIDLFGTMRSINPDTRDFTMSHIAKCAGVPPEGPWQIDLEWMDPEGLMKEPRPTQVDAKVESEKAVIFFEAKFGESDGGCCKQPLPTKNGLIQCNGNYEMQTNPVNQVSNHCALSGKGVRYWDVVPKIMKIEASESVVPCPFAGSWYQWMRNLTLAHEYGQRHRKTAAFVVVYAESPTLPFPRMLRSSAWSDFTKRVRTDKIALATISYQEVCRLAVTDSVQEHTVLLELQSWIHSKIENAERSRGLGRSR